MIAQLEQGVYKKDNRLLQRLEKKLGVWLTGDPDRIGTAKAEKEKKKAAQEKTAMADDKVKAAKKEDADSKITVDEDIPVIDDAPAADTETRELPEEK